MSVTFAAYTINDDGTWEEITPVDYLPIYEEDMDYGRILTNPNPLSLNIANGNFHRLMTLLGYSDFDYCGSFGDGSLQDLKSRIEFIRGGIKAIPDMDGGTPTIEHRSSPYQATMVECGLREGYFDDRLSTLLEIVNVAIKKGGQITYN